MKTIDCNKIVGMKIWENEDDYTQIIFGTPENNNSNKVIEFKTLEDVDKLIKTLKQFKKDYTEIVNNGHL